MLASLTVVLVVVDIGCESVLKEPEGSDGSSRNDYYAFGEWSHKGKT